MQRTLRTLVGLVLVSGLLSLGAGPMLPTYAKTTETTETAKAEGKLLLVLDSSGSMKKADAGQGGTRIAAAKESLNTVVGKLPDDATVGLRVYGATVFSKQDKGACSDSQLVVPIGRADKPALKQAIDRYKPYGETPIAYSLKQAAKDLGTDGQRSIVLVSDGEETCHPDPCSVARDIHAKGIDLKIDVVGLRVSGKAQDQLRCIANAGGGTYYDAEDADDLTRSIVTLSLRAFRPFQVSGTPVKGGLSLRSAPELGPGKYTDVVGSSGTKNGSRFYFVNRRPGSTVYVAATGRPGLTNDDRPIQVRLLTPSGEECSEDHQNGDPTAGYFSMSAVTTATAAYQNDPTDTDDDVCDLSRLLVEVYHGQKDNDQFVKGRGNMPYELVVVEEPKVRDIDAYNQPVSSEYDTSLVPPTKPLGEVNGGGGFSDAATLEPGTWTDSLQPGEQLFYRVKASWGQAPAVAFRLAPEQNGGDAGYFGPLVQTEVYAPHRQQLDASENDTYHGQYNRETGKDPLVLGTRLPTVKYDNRFSNSSTIATTSIDGYYYFSIEMGRDEDAKGWQAPMAISVDVDGQPGRAPAYVGPPPVTDPQPKREPEKDAGSGVDPSKSPKPDAAGSGSSPIGIVPLAVGGGTGLLLIAGLVVAIALIRRPTGPR